LAELNGPADDFLMKQFCVLLLGTVALATAETKIAAVPGQNQFAIEYGGATDLSGLAWVSGDTFYTVSNRVQALFPLKIEVDRTNGKIASAQFGAKIEVKAKLSDFEGIAYLPKRDRLYVSTERPPGIVGFNREGDATFAVEVPKVFAQARSNKGLEALTFGAGAMWTANEDALRGDGDTSSTSEGALVRLQKINERFVAAGQWAYRTDTSLLRISNSGTGVTDLVALPNGELLVLERVVAVGIVTKIYRVDFTNATDTSGMNSLQTDDLIPVKKKLLFERHTGAGNFEGIALGPELEDGWRSLILVADSGGDSRHLLMPLRIKFDPAP
jgi:hypothetical protein